MLSLAILFFACVVYLNYRISGSNLTPGSVFSAIWGASLIGIFLTGDLYYPLSPESLLIFSLGAASISGGALYVLNALRRSAPPYPTEAPPSNSAVSVWLNVLLLILIGGLPLYYELVLSQIGEVDPDMFMFRKRRFELENEESRGFDPVNNLPVLAFLVSAVSVYEHRVSLWAKIRAGIAALVALSYGAMTGSKASAITVLLTVMFILFALGRRLKLFVSVSIATVSLVVFSLGLIAVNFVGKPTPEVTDMVADVVESVQVYWLGGLVAFNAVAEAPESLESVQTLARPFLLTANSLGANYKIPSLHAAYSSIGGDNLTNTYTIYFSYYKDLGLIGTFGILIVLGGLLAWCYHRARYGRPIATIFYSMFCTGLVLSVHAEHFVLELNYYTKTLLFLLFLYAIPWSRLASDSIARVRLGSRPWNPEPGPAMGQPPTAIAHVFKPPSDR